MDAGQRWPRGVALLHWAAAALALATAGYGVYLLSPPDWSQRYIDRYIAGIAWHQTGGLAVLALALGWGTARLFVARPPRAGSPGARLAAGLVHCALFALLIVLPLSGYVGDALVGNDLRLIGGVTVPRLLRTDRELALVLSYVHKWGGFTLLGLAGLHLAGALRRALAPGDTTLRAMRPW